MLQPADVFIEKSGEEIRARTFLFSDPDGVSELCLRPDLTVPTCRWHLQHAPDPAAAAKYCYAGPVFRYHAQADAAQPQEYEQVGVEWFGASGPEADAEILALAVRAIREAAEDGDLPLAITIGDVGLIRALLQDIDMPPRWRARLLRRFRRPQAFRAALEELAGNGARRRTSISDLVDRLAEQPGMQRALALVEEELDARGLELVGGRSMEEIATRLLEKAENRNLPPLPADKVALLERFLAIAGPLKPVIVQLGKLAEEAGAHTRAAWQDYAKRVEHIARALPEEAMHITFDAGFGRRFDYYTGFVFQIALPAAAAAEGSVRQADAAMQPLAGGGRYDDMLKSLGGPDVPALGMALNMPRLQAALRLQPQKGREAAS